MFDSRLITLLDARLRADDRTTIDDEIWRSFGERWCIMATDLSGFSRGVADQGIIPFLQTIHESSRLLVPIVEQYEGRLLKTEGDSFLVIFQDVDRGLAAAIAMQRAVHRYNATTHDRILLGVGLGFGDVLRVADVEVYGGEVNSACILGESHARGFDILVTQAVRDAAAGDFAFEAFSFVPPGARGSYRLLYSSSENANAR